MTSREPIADLQALLAGSRVPRSLGREERVRLIGEAAQALLAGRLPSRESALFTGGALAAWLERGGDLEGQFFRVRQRGSHRTPDVLWRTLIADEDRSPKDALLSAPSNPEEGPEA